MVVGQSRNRRHLIGTSISKSFLVFYRFILFRFFFLLDRYGKVDPGRNLRLVRASLSSRCCSIATAKLSSFFSSFASSISFLCCWIATAKLFSLFVSFLPLFRPVAAGSLPQSCPAFSYRSCLPFRLAHAGSLRQSCPAHYHRPSSNFRFVFFLLDRYGKTVQLKFAFVHNKLNRRYLFGASI